MKTRIFIYIILTFSITIFSQQKVPVLFFETSSFIATGKNAPFWILSNNYGKYSNHWYNINYSAGLKTTFDTSKNIDYAYGAEIMNRIDDKYTIYPHELYIACKLWFFDIHAGWRKEVFGNAYPELTGGNLLWSGNARPMPKLSINIPEFTPFPFTKGYLEFKGNFAHGWFEKDRYVKGVLLHHKSMIGRIGGDLPVNITYGLHHFAQWGGTSPNPTYGKMPTDIEAFWWVFRAKESAPGDSIGGETINRYGNHIGSRNMGIDVKTKNCKTGFYWQTIFEDNSGKAWRNIKDGLWGIYWENKKENPLIKAIVVEYLNTTDQSGPSHDPVPELPQGGGRDNYFNNSVYMSGWTRYDLTIGTPFVTSQILEDSRYPQLSNNRIKMYNIGFKGNVSLNQFYLIKVCYNMNYGQYTYPYDAGHPNTFDPVRKNISALIEYNTYSNILKANIEFSTAFDVGKMYGNNIGFFVSFLKTF